jgi:hypothetical protein
MTQAGDTNQDETPKSGATAGVVALAVVMILASAPAVVYEARTANLASWVPSLLALGPLVGLLVTWSGGSFRDATPTPRAQATHFTYTGVMVALLLLVIALDGPTGLVVMSLVYSGGFWLLLVTSLFLWQQRRLEGPNA